MLKGKTIESEYTEQDMCRNNLSDDYNKFFNEQIRDLATISYYKIAEEIVKYYEYSNDEIINKSGSEKEKLVKLKNNILLQILKATESELPFNNDIEELKELRREIVTNIKSLNSYMNEILYYNEILNYLIIRENIKNNVLQNEEINVQIFIQEIYRFIIVDTNSIFFKIRSLIRVLPLKIAKAKYYDILKKSLIKELQGSSCETIDFKIIKYKQLFNGTMTHEYGVKYDKYFRETQKYKNIDLKKLSLNELKENEILTARTFLEMNKLARTIANWGLLVNNLICVNMLNDKEKKLIVDNNRSLHNKLKRYLNTKDKKLGNNIKDICDMNVHKLEDNINVRDNTNLIKLQEMLLYQNDLSLETEEVVITQNKRADFNYLDQSIDNLIQYIDRNIRSMDVLQRKIRMRRLLSAIPEVFDSIEDFMIYVSDILNFTSSKEELLMIVNDIKYVMDNFK